MNLNLPIIEQLTACKNILIAGMGGGFDIFCGLPIYFDLQQQGFNVHLANLTHASLQRLRGARRLLPSLIGVNASTESFTPYFPELHLARWFKSHLNQDITIWCFERSGVVPLIKHYRTLVEQLQLDAILLVDGGVDSLIRGDENEIGSPLEDASSIAALTQLNEVSIRISACLGLGAELEITYAQIFENIASLTKLSGFLGSCSLIPQMESYGLYESAVLYTQEQPRQDASVINSSVVSAVQGHFDNYHLTEKTQNKQLWISPLMPIYWFFDLQVVAKQNVLLDAVLSTQTFEEVYQAITSTLQSIPKRPILPIQLK